PRDSLGAPADGAEDSDLADSLEHGHRHRVRDADPTDDEREDRDDPARREDEAARRVDLDRLPRLGDRDGSGKASFDLVGDLFGVVPELHDSAHRRDLTRSLRDRLEHVKWDDDAEVLEAVAGVVDACHGKRPPTDAHAVADVLARAVTDHHVTTPAA